MNGSPEFMIRGPGYRLTRQVLLRAISFIYAVGFLILVRQGKPLIGADGLLPASVFLSQVSRQLGSKLTGFFRLPSVFWLGSSDAALSVGAWLGLGLALLGCAGFGNAVSFALLWLLYLSFVHIGQIFYGYGWESLLCEAGFLCIFLAPALSPRISSAPRPETILIVLFRWLTFRVMFGAGLIKLRGDPCWTDLTCLIYHYETQPNPNPLSPYFHHLPAFVHRGGVVFNHLVEVAAPFGVFGPRRVRLCAGALIVVFQAVLIASGNLSFLNWLTIAVALSCFDDGVFSRIAKLLRRLPGPEALEPSRARRIVNIVLAVGIGLLSLNPIVNLLSSRQAMNASFDPFQIVNTYGAFGSVGRVRNEVVLEGTADPSPGPDAKWIEYGLPCKPGDPLRRPCLVSPYHYRLDWQMWFLAMGPINREPWALNLVYKLLRGDHSIDALIENPFPDRPPRFVRAVYYRYRFAPSSTPATWERERLGTYLRPLSRDDAELRDYLRLYGLVE